MSSISFTAHGRCARATVCEPITTGSVGLSVSFAFDAAWSGLQKTAIFRGSGMAVDLVLSGDAATVPPEVLTIPGGDLRIGVWGADPDGNVIIPTVWATVGEIVPGAAPSGFDPDPPTPSWAAQVQEISLNALNTANSVREDADAGEFDGATYTPAVSAGGDLSWTNDKGKPNPPTVNIKGPEGQPGQTGATPDISIGTVETLPPGSPATATITGTAENPVLSFGIPEGQQGAPGEVTQAEFDDLADEVTRQKSALRNGYISFSNIEQGSLTTNGETVESTSRIRINPQPVNAGDVLKIDSNLYYGILIWNGSPSTANVIRNDVTGCPNGTDEVLFIHDGYFAMTFRNEASSAVTPSDFEGFVHLYNSYQTETDTLKSITPILYKYGYYYNANIGETIAIYDSSNFNSAVFDVKPNTTYKLQAQGRTITSIYFHVVDSNNVSLDKFGHAPTVMGGMVEVVYTTPPTASKIMINCTAGVSPVAGKSMQYAKLFEIKTSVLQADYTPNYTQEQKQNMVTSLGIEVPESDLMSREQFTRALGAAKLFAFNDFAQNIAENQLPTFVQVSDIHGDADCFNFAVDVADKINADGVICTGDVVYYYSTDDASFVERKMSDASTPFFPCIGNHDSYVNTTAQMYSKFIEPFRAGLIFPSGVSNPTYYYKDIAEKKIRIICVNQFEYRGVSNYTTQRNYTQEQINFLCNALENTPAGYGVVISMHTPEKSGAIASQYPKFYQTEISYDNTGADIWPVYEIVDAFISGITINKTWNNISGNSPASFTANADFSAKNSGVEFIAYMTGHMHRDCIYYVPGMTNKQLMLNVTCTCHWSYRNTDGSVGGDYPYFTESGDLPRVEGTPTQNAINVYGIDRRQKRVKVARIGSEMPYDMDIRDFMSIPYAD